MKKNCLLMAVAGLALAAVNAPETMAQETTGVEIYRTSTLQVTGNIARGNKRNYCKECNFFVLPDL